MEFIPVYGSCHPHWSRRCAYRQQHPTLMRDLVGAILTEVLSQSLRQRQPEKWTQKFKIAGFRPDEVKISVKEDKVIVHARRIIGDEDDCDSREMKRTVKVPENVDTDKITGKMDDNGYLVIEGPFINTAKEQENPSPLKCHKSQNESGERTDEENTCKNDVSKTESTSESQEVDNRTDFEMRLDLPNFEPDDISVTCEDNVLKVKAKSVHNENGVESTRSFYRMCTLPRDVSVDHVKCIRENDGTMSIRLPYISHKSITAPDDRDAENTTEHNNSTQKDSTTESEHITPETDVNLDDTEAELKSMDDSYTSDQKEELQTTENLESA